MAIDRLSIAADAGLGSRIRAAALRDGVSISAWLTQAAEDRLRNELLGRTLADWESEHGAPTPEQEAEASAFFERVGAIRQRSSAGG